MPDKRQTQLIKRLLLNLILNRIRLKLRRPKKLKMNNPKTKPLLDPRKSKPKKKKKMMIPHQSFRVLWPQFKRLKSRVKPLLQKNSQSKHFIKLQLNRANPACSTLMVNSFQSEI